MPKRKSPKRALAPAVGARLRGIRIARKVSQQRVAEAVGLTQGSIFNYEHGFRDIPVVNLIAILDHFDISLAEFMAGVPQLRVLDDSADIGIAKRLIADGRADRRRESATDSPA